MNEELPGWFGLQLAGRSEDFWCFEVFWRGSVYETYMTEAKKRETRKADAYPRKMVRATGFEPVTSTV